MLVKKRNYECKYEVFRDLYFWHNQTVRVLDTIKHHSNIIQHSINL